MLHLKNKPIQIIHVSTEMTMGGGERQLLYLYKGLQKKNIAQIILCATGSALEKYATLHHYKTISLQRRGSFNFRYAWELKNILTNMDNHHHHILHSHDAHAHTHIILADIINLHRNAIPCIASRKLVPSRNKKYRNYLKLSYPTTKKIICVSQAIANIFKNWSTSILDKIIVLHDTLVCSDYLPPKQRQQSRYVIGIIASLIPVKNHALFLSCAKKIIDTHRNQNQQETSFEFWIIGNGPLLNKLIHYSKELGIAPHVKFLGFREDIPEILSQLDLLLVTSQNEGLCSTILQSMAAQVPVIAKNVGGIQEIIQHKKTGLLAENDSELVKYALQLHNNPVFAKTLTQSALKFIQAYDLSIYTEKMLAIYQNEANSHYI